MILDTSPVLAVCLSEPAADWVKSEIRRAQRVLMSTINLAETLILIRDRLPERAARLEEELVTSGIQFIAPDVKQASLAASARLTFPLNFGDCFAYALAKQENLPLLTLDRDFRATDIQILLPPA